MDYDELEMKAILQIERIPCEELNNGEMAEVITMLSNLINKIESLRMKYAYKNK